MPSEWAFRPPLSKMTSNRVIYDLFIQHIICELWKSRVSFFAAVNHLSARLCKHAWVVIGRFLSILFVSFFQGRLVVIVIMIDGSEKRNRYNNYNNN